MIFVKTDLNLSQTELDEMTAQLANATRPDPITDCIAEQLQKVLDYTLRYAMPDPRTKRLVKALVMFELHFLLGTVSDARQKAYDEAMKELEGIRDGKFTDLKFATPAPVDLATMPSCWGSNKKISTAK